MAGLAKELNDNTLGVFFEYGGSSYDTNNSFASGDIKGDGNASYTGGGLLGHFALENNNYIEASARRGQIKTDVNSKDYVDAGGLNAKYDFDTLYYGAHIGAGHIFELAEQFSLNGYGKYLWTHQNGKEVSLPTSEKVDFAAADSHRVRAGLKLAYNQKGVFSPYAGAAYEQELAGKADAKISGLDVDAPSLKGGTAIGELGLKVSHNYLSADLGAQGYGGKRKGVSGSLKLNYRF
jgi:outer membrane autotransporter protein